MKKSEVRKMIREMIQSLNEASITNGFEKSLEKLISDIESGKGVDKRMAKEKSVGELLGMFLTPIFQSKLLSVEDMKGFYKYFKVRR